ncbi:MAG TPA: cytochrome b [Steroidobacteraceae bacterium]|nr:cytochrome b [Steroidobacteraceae bacterium]
MTQDRYDGVAQLLHWTTVLLVAVLLVLGKAGLVGEDQPASAWFMWHGSLGILVLALVAFRLLWRLVRPPPDFPSTMMRAGRIAARAMHVSLYVLLVALPLTGWLAASSEGNHINLFNVATLPLWDGSAAARPGSAAAPQGRPIAAMAEDREELSKESHELLGDALLILVSLHFLAALKHQFIDHDGLIRRMLPSARPRSARVGRVGE